MKEELPSVYLTINSFIQEMQVVVSITRTYEAKTMTNFYRVDYEDDDTVTFTGDVSPYTRQTIISTALATLRLRRVGFDREP